MSNEDQREDLHVTAFNRRFVGFIARRPLVSVLLSVLMVLPILAGMGRLRADFTHTGFFWSDDPKLKKFEAFERKFGNDDVVMVSVHSPSGVFDVETATLLKEMTERMWQVPEIIRVDSLSNFNWVHAKGDEIVIEPLFPDALTPEVLAERRNIALAHEVLPNYLVSEDGNVAMIHARVRPAIDRPSDAGAITRAVNKLTAELTRGDHTFHVAGGPPITFAFESITQQDIQRLVPMVVGLALIFLLALLRSLAGSLLPFAVVFLSVLCAFGFAGWAGLVQTAMTTVIPSILIAVGIADTVHILITYFEQRRQGVPRKEAAHYTLTKNLLATFLTSLTTAIGFFSFVGANLKPMGIMGMMAGVGTLVCWLLAQMLVGGLLFLLPIKVRPIPPERVAANERRAHGLVNLIIRRRAVVIGVTVALSAICFFVSLGVEINSDPMKYFRKGVPIRDASDFIEQSVKGARVMELVIDTNQEEGIKDPVFLAKVDAFQKWLAAQPGISRAVSILDVLKQTHRSLNGDQPEAYVVAKDRDTIAQELLLYTMGLPQGMDVNDRISVKNDSLRMTVFNTLGNSREYVAGVKTIEAKGKELGLTVEGTGKYYLYQGTNEYVVQSFLTSLWSASLLIGLIMAIFLRSAKLGIISMIPNVVPLFAGGVLLRLMNQPLDMGTALVASVCLGISIDDTSHVLANFAYLRRRGMPPNDAVRAVMVHTGPALLSTNAILITSFATFATASFIPNVYFGILTAFILTVALLADMFFTPAMLVESPAREEARKREQLLAPAFAAPERKSSLQT